MSNIEDTIKHSLLDITDPIQFGAEEYWCAMKCLDDLGIPRKNGDNTLSIVGRIKYLTDDV